MEGRIVKKKTAAQLARSMKRAMAYRQMKGLGNIPPKCIDQTAAQIHAEKTIPSQVTEHCQPQKEYYHLKVNLANPNFQTRDRQITIQTQILDSNWPLRNQKGPLIGNHFQFSQEYVHSILCYIPINPNKLAGSSSCNPPVAGNSPIGTMQSKMNEPKQFHNAPSVVNTGHISESPQISKYYPKRKAIPKPIEIKKPVKPIQSVKRSNPSKLKSASSKFNPKALAVIPNLAPRPPEATLDRVMTTSMHKKPQVSKNMDVDKPLFSNCDRIRVIPQGNINSETKTPVHVPRAPISSISNVTKPNSDKFSIMTPNNVNPPTMTPKNVHTPAMTTNSVQTKLDSIPNLVLISNQTHTPNCDYSITTQNSKCDNPIMTHIPNCDNPIMTTTTNFDPPMITTTADTDDASKPTMTNQTNSVRPRVLPRNSHIDRSNDSYNLDLLFADQEMTDITNISKPEATSASDREKMKLVAQEKRRNLPIVTQCLTDKLELMEVEFSMFNV